MQELEFEPWVDAGKVAEHLGFTKTTIRKMAEDGYIPAVGYGTGNKKSWRFQLSAVDAAFRGHVLSVASPTPQNRKAL